MNIEDVKKLTPEEKRVRLAELCGYTRHDESYPYPKSSNGICKRIVWKNRAGEVIATANDFLPNYCNDLNAVAEVENTLTDEQFERYMTDVWRISNGDQPRQESAPIKCERAYLCANAETRCEALILTLSEK